MLTTLKYRAAETKDAKQFRRLWWSCFIREQTVALCMQQSPSMQYPHGDIPMIDYHDFDDMSLVGNNLRRSAGNAAPDAPSTIWYSPHTTWFIESAKLAILLGSGSAHPQSYQAGAEHVEEAYAQASAGLHLHTAALHAKLVAWHRELPSQINYFTCGNETSPPDARRNGAVSQILPATLLITYYLNLVRENTFTDNGAIGHDQVFDRALHQKYAEDNVVQILHDLCENMVLHHMPTLLIDGVLSLATERFLGADQASESCVNNSMRGFRRCLQLFRVMGNRLQVNPQDHLEFRFSLVQAMHHLQKETLLLNYLHTPTSSSTPSFGESWNHWPVAMEPSMNFLELGQDLATSQKVRWGSDRRVVLYQPMTPASCL